MAGILSGNVLGADPSGVGFLPLPLPLTLAPLIGHYTGQAASSAVDTATTAAQKVQSEIPITVEEKEDEEGVWGSDTALWVGLLVVGGLVALKVYNDKKKTKKVKENRRRRRRVRRNMSTEQVPAWQAVRTESMPMHKGQVLIGAPLQQKRDDYKHEGMEAADDSIKAGHGASAKARDAAWSRRKKSIRSSLMTPRTTQLLEQSWKQGWDLRAKSAGYAANRRPRRNASILEYIRPGDRVTILTPHGQQRTGRAVMRGPAGWVLNMGGKYGTPGIATNDNITKVSRPRARRRKS